MVCNFCWQTILVAQMLVFNLKKKSTRLKSFLKNNLFSMKYQWEKWDNLNLGYFLPWIYGFVPWKYGAMQTLPRKIMELCRLCPAKSQSLCTLPRKITEPWYFAPRNYGAMLTLPREIMEQCWLCPAKSRRHSFRGQNNNLTLGFLFFPLTFFFCK